MEQFELPPKGVREECGVFGAWNCPEAANLTYLGLYALQHRGQEGAGIVSSDDESLHAHRGLGLVSDIFDAQTLDALPGGGAIGHVRYSTAGSEHIKNVQPLAIDYRHGALAIAHNGNLVNADELVENLEKAGAIFSSNSDTEVILHLIARSKQNSAVDRLIDALYEVQGAYSLVILTEKRLLAARDALGFRPLVLGRLDDGYVLASETCAFDLIGAEYLREIERGEVIDISADGLRSYRPFWNKSEKSAECVFEFIYFARPDSMVFGRNVYEVRKRLGRILARETPVEADVVVPVPDSGVPAAMGFAEESGIPFEMGFIRNHYVGRTFIEPRQAIRHFGVKIKLNPVREVLAGKRVVVVDDSIVRGTTSQKIVKEIRACGVREVHMRISAPPTVAPCYYGVDTPNREQLMAAVHPVDEIRRFITADSLSYLSAEGMRKAAGRGRNHFCDACFTDNYPIRKGKSVKERQMRLFEVNS